jgi:curved DNA-binding protein CbpA
MKEGLLSEEDLYAGLAYQMREVILNIFPYFGGKFKFQERSKFAEEEFKSKISIPDLIEEGIRRMKHFSQVEKFMGKKVPFPTSEEFIDRLTEEEWKIIETIDGNTPAEGLIHTGDFSPEFFWMSLYLSYCLNIIDIKDVEKVPVKKEKPEKPAFEIKDKKLAEVIAMSEQLPTMDYYQILKVPDNASSYQIKLSYFRLAREYHPDCFSKDLPSDIKEKVEDVFAHIKKAYDTLGEEKKKHGYDSKREVTPDLSGKELEKEADIKYRQGRTLCNQERYEEAIKVLEEAVRLKKNKAIYFLVLGKAKSKVPPFHKKAEEDFQKAIMLEPSNPECYVGLGTYYKGEGLSDKAKKQFKKALEVDPVNQTALKELGLTEKSKKKGITKIFKPSVKKKD